MLSVCCVCVEVFVVGVLGRLCVLCLVRSECVVYDMRVACVAR